MADITNSVMSIYHGLSEEERNSPEDRTYIDRTQASLDACIRPMSGLYVLSNTSQNGLKVLRCYVKNY